MQQLAAFSGVGVLATACHYLVLVVLVEFGGMSVVPASALGAMAGALTGYRLNYSLTFQSEALHRKTAPRYLVIAALALAANTGLMVLLYEWGGLPYMVAQVMTTGLVFILTFTGNRLWTFAADTPE